MFQEELAYSLPHGDDWVDISETSTIVGWSSLTTKVIRYMRIGKTIVVMFAFSGTSNSVSANFTVPLKMSAERYDQGWSSAGNSIYVVDNGAIANLLGRSQIVRDGTTVFLFRSPNGTAWTAAGTKVVNGTLIYPIQES